MIDAPPAIRHEADHLQKHTCREVIAERLSPRRWRLVSASSRVRVTVDYKLSMQGRASWAASTLEVDGEPRPLARNCDELGRIFADPDAQATTLPEMPPEAAIADAPPMVRHFWQMLTGRLGEVADRAQLGADSTRWVIALQAPDRTTGIQLVFRRSRKQRKGQWWMRLKVVINGINRSSEVDDDLNKALALLAGSDLIAPAQTPPSVAAAPVPPKRYDSVAQRRNAVIRT